MYILSGNFRGTYYKRRISISLFISSFIVIYGPILDVGIGIFADTAFFFSLALTIFGLNVNCFQNITIKQLYSIIVVLGIYSLLTFFFFDNDNLEESIRAILRPLRIAIMITGTWYLVNLYYTNYVKDFYKFISKNIFLIIV